MHKEGVREGCVAILVTGNPAALVEEPEPVEALLDLPARLEGAAWAYHATYGLIYRW